MGRTHREDCSLWAGIGLEWMLVGTADGGRPVTEETFARQWNDPVTGPELRGLGFERPEFFGTTFLADAPALRQLTAGSDPLDDDHRRGSWPPRTRRTSRCWT